MLSTSQLKQMKDQLRHFSHNVTGCYDIIKEIYHAQVNPQSLIDSEITRCFVRIGLKKVNEDDDPKFKKSVNICRRKVKEWKEILQVFEEELEDIPMKKVKSENAEVQKLLPSTIHKIQQQQQQQEQGYVDEHCRIKAKLGLFQFLKKSSEQFSEKRIQEVCMKLEDKLFLRFKNQVEIYKNKVKKLAKIIDQNYDFRNNLLSGQIEVDEALRRIE